MIRRNFLKMLASLPLCGFLGKEFEKAKPELVTMKARYGFKARVFLDGKEMHDIVEIKAAPKPDTPMQGSLLQLSTGYDGEFLFETKEKNYNFVVRKLSGEIYWQPLKEA